MVSLVYQFCGVVGESSLFPPFMYDELTAFSDKLIYASPDLPEEVLYFSQLFGMTCQILALDKRPINNFWIT